MYFTDAEGSPSSGSGGGGIGMSLSARPLINHNKIAPNNEMLEKIGVRHLMTTFGTIANRSQPIRTR